MDFEVDLLEISLALLLISKTHNKILLTLITQK